MTETEKILAVKIDSQFTLDEHSKSIIIKAAVGQFVLAKVANCHWALDVGTTHIAHNAVIDSLLRYALTATGSVFPPDLVGRVNTQIINTAARKIGGVSRTTRMENLHLILNTMAFMNLYVTHFFLMDDCM